MHRRAFLIGLGATALTPIVHEMPLAAQPTKSMTALEIVNAATRSTVVLPDTLTLEKLMRAKQLFQSYEVTQMSDGLIVHLTTPEKSLMSHHAS